MRVVGHGLRDELFVGGLPYAGPIRRTPPPGMRLSGALRGCADLGTYAAAAAAAVVIAAHAHVARLYGAGSDHAFGSSHHFSSQSKFADGSAVRAVRAERQQRATATSPARGLKQPVGCC